MITLCLGEGEGGTARGGSLTEFCGEGLGLGFGVDVLLLLLLPLPLLLLLLLLLLRLGAIHLKYTISTITKMRTRMIPAIISLFTMDLRDRVVRSFRTRDIYTQRVRRVPNPLLPTFPLQMRDSSKGYTNSHR